MKRSDRPRLLLAAALCAAFTVSTSGIARAGDAEDSCEAAISKAGAKYFNAYVKAVNACELGRSNGKLDIGTNCRPADGAVTDEKTSSSITKAVGKLNDAITKACTGATLSAVHVAAPCDAEPDVASLASCLASDGFGSDAERLVELVFDDTGSLVGKDATISCQKTVASSLAKLAAARVKERTKCVKALAGGKTAGPCPDAAADEKLAAAVAKADDSIASKCAVSAVDGGTNSLDPGFPCDLYLYATFKRGAGNTNMISVPSRFRRCMLAGGSGIGDLAANRAERQAEPSAFPYGVAAGDATDSSFIVWTKTASGSDVTLQVASDSAFTSLVDTQVLTPDGSADNTVKYEVSGLTASTEYFYRFTQGADVSRSGRVKTITTSPLLASLRFSFTGDANAYFQPFTVLDQITSYDPDFWLFIGDTIYGDDARSGTGVATVRSDYWTKYKENRSDRATRDLMANVATWTMWDDHETTNDVWGTDPAIQTQMAAGNQAFRDYMPIKENGGDAMQLYRSFKVGELAEFFLIDARQYRSSQAYHTEPACITGSCSVTNADCATNGDCGVNTCRKGTCSIAETPCSSAGDCPMGETCDDLAPDTTPNATCVAEMENPSRTYLGATQLAWLESALQASTATFKFVANGPLLSELQFVPYDRWEGYAAERQQFLDFVTTNDIKNVIFLSTDIHAAIVNNPVSGSPISEVVSGAIGMDSIYRELPGDVSALIASLPLVFPTVQYYDIDRFNVTNVSLTSSAVTFEYRDDSGQLLESRTIAAQ